VRIADVSPKRLVEKLGHVQVQRLCTGLDWTYHRWVGRENQDHVMGLSICPVFPATASLFTRATPHSETDERTQASCLSPHPPLLDSPGATPHSHGQVNSHPNAGSRVNIDSQPRPGATHVYYR
jgi:hypothetical protein